MRIQSMSAKKQTENPSYHRTSIQRPESMIGNGIFISGFRSPPKLSTSQKSENPKRNSPHKSYPFNALAIAGVSNLSILPMGNSNPAQISNNNNSNFSIIPMNTKPNIIINNSAVGSNISTGRRVYIDKREPVLIPLQMQMLQDQQQIFLNQPVGKVQRLNLLPLNKQKNYNKKQEVLESDQGQQLHSSSGFGLSNNNSCYYKQSSPNKSPMMMRFDGDSQNDLDMLDDFEQFNQSKFFCPQNQNNFIDIRSPQIMVRSKKISSPNMDYQYSNKNDEQYPSPNNPKPFLSPQKNHSSDFNNNNSSQYLQLQQLYPQQAQQQQNSKLTYQDQLKQFTRRSSSAVNKQPKSSNIIVQDEKQAALFANQTKAPYAVKRYSNPAGTEQEKLLIKDQQQSLKQKEKLAQFSVRQSAAKFSSDSAILPESMKKQSNVRRLHSLIGQAETNHEGGPEDFDEDEDDDEEDDEGEEESNQNDVSLDLDEEEEIQGESKIITDIKSTRDSNKVTNNVQMTSAPVLPVNYKGKPVYLLKSIYPGRPSTVLFPYHKSCQQAIPRDLSRAVICTEIEIKKFDLKYKINGDNPYKCVVKAFEEAGFEETEESDWNAMWSLPKKDKVKNMHQFQKYNHFPGCWNLGRKDFMWRCLNRCRRKFPKDFDFIPNTYLLCHQGDWDRFCAKREEATKNQLWICKPADQACGRGVKVITKTSKIKRKSNRIISEYIANPHLINGFKYDLRLYVLVSSYDPLRIYIYEEGLTRFATEPYTTSTKEVKKRYIHLTNYSVNKYAKKFVKNTNPEADGEGSKWSISALKKKYISLGIDVDKLFGRIQDVIIKTCISAEPQMLDLTAKSSEHRNNCYELYGFDILIDSKLKPWILEVNVCPSLSSSSPLDRKIKHSLLVDTLNLIGILPFEKKKYAIEKKKKGSSTGLDGKSENSGRRSMIFNENGLDNGKNSLNKRSGVSLHRAKTMIEGSEEFENKVQGSILAMKKKSFSKNINDVQELTSENCLEKLSPENWEVLFETDEEYHRRGHYSRIFPPDNKPKRNYYMQFFEFQRFNNLIVHNWMNSGSNFLEKIIKRKYNQNV